MEHWHEVRDRLREFALRLPEAYEEHPWGETVVKVNKKIFVFLGPDEPADTWRPQFSVKLRQSHGHALSVPGAVPTSHNLGRSGWVTVPLAAAEHAGHGGHAGHGVDLLLDWVDESYRTIAPKRLVALLDTDGPA
ncbi:Predicted DNA-binding protein, MmcQ/YjbR family [Sinosporangium album]|uniref:Predicted DNA-binding protein, MmcQ/YjbR family n=1 Tax=Sinosporangium album TaxID=504805 RepID=A0A1G8HGD5_9ACTN|nr:MmcQ/YjbR family DNA-binding protein [Sinosporangium album]SDI05734.1 Predicted DNA-binding protein, MmcQ/YjbR family [Sinosporangium album]